MNTYVHVEKNFRIVQCGYVEPDKDSHGNTLFWAHNIIDDYQHPFYDKGAAEHWLKLCGMNRG